MASAGLPGMRGGSRNFFFFFQAEDGIRDRNVTAVQTCALPIYFVGHSLILRTHHLPPSSRWHRKPELPRSMKWMGSHGTNTCLSGVAEKTGRERRGPR